MSSLPDPDQLLTRDHLDLRLRAEFADLRREVLGEMNALEVRVGGAMGDHRNDLVGQMGDLRTDLTGEMHALETRVGGAMDDLRTDVRETIVEQTKWLVGTLLASIFAFGTLLVAAMAVLS